MAVATSLTYAIRQVADVGRAAVGVRIAFRAAPAAFLEDAHPHFAACQANAETRAGRPAPVGVVVDANGRVLDLNAAHDTAVRFIRDDPSDRRRLLVGFWAYSP